MSIEISDIRQFAYFSLFNLYTVGIMHNYYPQKLYKMFRMMKL